MNTYANPVIEPGNKLDRPNHYKPIKLPGKQSGVVLFIALIALVAMTLAAIALVRSTDTGNVIAGNLAFRQGATAANDMAAEAAITTLATFADQAASYNDNALVGYYATGQQTLDMTGNHKGDVNYAGVNWDNDNCGGGSNYVDCINPGPEVSLALAPGYKARPIIHRLCSSVGAATLTNGCASFTSTISSAAGSNQGSIYQGKKNHTAAPVTYYRITTRVTGPRNTTSYAETIVHF